MTLGDGGDLEEEETERRLVGGVLDEGEGQSSEVVKLGLCRLGAALTGRRRSRRSIVV